MKPGSLSLKYLQRPCANPRLGTEAEAALTRASGPSRRFESAPVDLWIIFAEW
jgi:hypothetical protein